MPNATASGLLNIYGEAQVGPKYTDKTIYVTPRHLRVFSSRDEFLVGGYRLTWQIFALFHLENAAR